MNNQDIVVHPQYKSNLNYNDLALVQLKHPIELSPSVWPACLVPDVKLKPIHSFSMIGFGRKAGIFEQQKEFHKILSASF